MNIFLRFQNFFWINIIFGCFSLIFTSDGISKNETNFNELCRFDGMCLDCKDGGCEDMCNFYDNNCCVNSTSTNTALKKWQYSCARKFPDMYDLHLDCRGSFNGVYGVYMVTKCSEGWKDALVKDKCEDSFEEDILSRIPVYDIMNEVVTYKNMYCAFCNRISLRRLRFWKFDLMCNTEFRINEDGYDTEFFNDDCFIRLAYRQHRMCVIDVIESCNKTGNINSTLRDKCERGLQQHVYVWKTERVFSVYKNEFCASCNYEVGDELQCWAFQAFTCWPKNLPPYESVEAKINLKLNGYTNTDSIELFNSTCGEGVIYNPFDQKCLNITCLPSQNICISGMCRLVELSASDFLIQNDSSLYFLALGDFIQDGRYFVENSNVHVCLDDDQYSEFELIQETTLKTTIVTTENQSTETSVTLATTSVTSSERDVSSDISAVKVTLPVLILQMLVWRCVLPSFQV